MRRLLLTGALFLCSLLTTFAQFSGSGSGTENDPYLIFNETQLSQMANFLGQDGVVFKLMKDLDLTDWIAENNPSQGWLPVGVESSPFKGKLYGNNHKISGLMISRGSSSYVGFFGNMQSATVTDLSLFGSTVEGSTYTGFFAGNTTNCTFSNITVTATNVNGSGFFIGNDSGSKISSVSATGEVNGNGGFLGKGSSSTLENVKATVSVTHTGGIGVGGIVGEGHGLTINNATAEGNITGTADVGGIVGNLEGTCSLTNCSYEGNIESVRNTGGIVGYLYIVQGGTSSSVSFTSCLSKGKIIVTGDCVGGVLGISNGGCIAGMESCSHFGEIHGVNYVGGLIGFIRNATEEPSLHTWSVYSKINSDRTPEGTLYSSYQSSILQGNANSVSINNCTCIGNICGTTYVGGLVGYDQPTCQYEASSKNVYVGKYGYLFKDNVYLNMSPL